MKTKMVKYNTSKAKFRVFKNRFSSYLLQKKEKTSTNGEWKILNAFAEKKSALKFLEAEQRKEIRADLKRHLTTLA